MKLDEAGKNLIKRFEALRLSPYLDREKVWTIGWGHTYGVNEKTLPIDETQAEVFFSADCEPCEEIITKSVKIDLTQNEFNALVSFTFNEGVSAFHNSTLLKKLNSGDRQGAAKEFDRWIYATDKETGEISVVDDLIIRRALEKTLFLSDFLATRVSSAG